jgi:hypothetical protein
MWCVAYMHFWNKVIWGWFFLAHLFWTASSSPSFFSFNHGLYTLTPVKYNTIYPNTYVIRAYSITKIYNIYVSSTFMSMVVYVTQHMPHNITN